MHVKGYVGVDFASMMYMKDIGIKSPSLKHGWKWDTTQHLYFAYKYECEHVDVNIQSSHCEA